MLSRSARATVGTLESSRLAPVCTAMCVLSELGRLNRLLHTGLRRCQFRDAVAPPRSHHTCLRVLAKCASLAASSSSCSNRIMFTAMYSG